MSTMRAGTDTGSLVNNLYSRMTKGAPAPFVGQGATLLLWTDRHAATVIKVEGRIIEVQQDTATRTDDYGMSDCQSYSYQPNPDGAISTFRMGKDGGFDQVRLNEATGRYNKIGNGGLVLGKRDEHYDFSF